MRYSAIALCGAALATCASASLIPLNPRATYLRTNNDTAALNAPAVALSSLGAHAGDALLIERVGDWRPNNGMADAEEGLIAIFSSTAQLMSPGTLHRVAGAIDCGPDVDTPPTFHELLPTDIGEDFIVDSSAYGSSTLLEVPAGAAYLFFSVNDSYFGDNSDPDGDFGANITVVPEPAGAIALLFAALRRRRPR